MYVKPHMSIFMLIQISCCCNECNRSRKGSAQGSLLGKALAFSYGMLAVLTIKGSVKNMNYHRDYGYGSLAPKP